MANTVTDSTKNVTGFEAISQATTHTSTATGKTLGKDDFLKMLLAQMKNQDPLNPQDGAQFASQLAQFSSLEQLQNLNASISNQTLSMTTMAHTQAVSMIGKTVNISGGNSLVAAGQPLDINYTLDKDAQNVVVSILDQNGNEVKTITASDQKAGQNSVKWDMSSDTKGSYTFKVSATDASGSDVTASTMAQGTVSAVQFKSDGIYVIVNGQELPFSDVTSVSDKTT
ncbi:MAG: hypothetical protein CSYNP_01488 [Syntrophus sp. SKADARSKE-3]|nr:hypothetical protein [Syntrophus sp. SKADARSKE-3]